MIAVLLSLFSSLLLSTTAQTQVLPQAPTHSQPSTPQAIPPTIPLLWAASPFQADPRSTINSTISFLFNNPNAPLSVQSAVCTVSWPVGLLPPSFTDPTPCYGFLSSSSSSSGSGSGSSSSTKDLPPATSKAEDPAPNPNANSSIEIFFPSPSLTYRGTAKWQMGIVHSFAGGLFDGTNSSSSSGSIGTIFEVDVLGQSWGSGPGAQPPPQPAPSGGGSGGRDGDGAGNYTCAGQGFCYIGPRPAVSAPAPGGQGSGGNGGGGPGPGPGPVPGIQGGLVGRVVWVVGGA